MVRRLGMLAATAAMMLAAAAPVAAAASHERWIDTFTTDPYVLAECEGYDVIEQDDAYFVIDSYFDRDGNWLRDVFHASTTGTVWRSDTEAQLATYGDAGGTFTTTSRDRFTWTGIHGVWTLTDGSTVTFVGRVVVEVIDGSFERTFGAGSYDDLDPCSW